MKKKIICLIVLGIIIISAQPMLSAMEVKNAEDNTLANLDTTNGDMVTIEIYAKKEKDDSPINRAWVVLLNGLNYDQGKTDDDGYIKFEGNYSQLLPITIEISKFGYRLVVRHIYFIKPGETVTLDLKLKGWGDAVSKQVNHLSLLDIFPILQRLLLKLPAFQ